MRLTFFVLVSLFAVTATAQDAQKGPFVIELDDEQIEQLKNGYQLQTKFPPEIRDKITVIQVRYKPAAATGQANQAGNPPPRNINGFGVPRSLSQTNSNPNTGPPPVYGPPVPANWQNRMNSNRSASSPQGFAAPRNNDPAVSVLSNNVNSGKGFQNQPPRSPNTFPNNSSTNPGGSFSGGANTNRGGATSGNSLLPIDPNSALNSGNSGWNTPASGNSTGTLINGAGTAPATGNQFQPGNSLNRSPNSLHTPNSNPTNYNYNRQSPNSSQPGPPQGTEFDTRFRSGSPNPMVNQTNILPPPPQSNRNQFAETNNVQQWTRENQFRQAELNQYPLQTNQQFAPTVPVNQTDLSRRSSLMAGYHTPALPNQVPAPQDNLTGHRVAQNLSGQTTGDGSNSLLTPPALINGNAPGHRPAGADGKPPISSIDQANRFNGVLWFMLLCSFGLNIYLGWISRGFYVRYRELADELRETFSTAV